MKIVITSNSAENEFDWTLFDGPDGIDEYSGTEESLGACFERIIKTSMLNGASYYE